jgi:nitroreductase
MDVTEAIRTRRSIRKMKTDPIDDETLENVLEAARWAPSWKNNQCWRFVVVRDSKIKEEIAGCMITTRSGENPSTRAIIRAPVLIVACAELGKSGLNAGEFATDKGDWFMYDVALAMQNLVLEAHSLGLGTVHLGLFDAEKAAGILGVPEGFCVVSMTPLGYPDEAPNSVPRKELSEFVSYDEFGG